MSSSRAKGLMYRCCICLCLQISIAASYLLCIMYFSVVFHGLSLMYSTWDKNNSYLMETVSTIKYNEVKFTHQNFTAVCCKCKLFGCNKQLRKFTAKNMIPNVSDTNTQFYIHKQILPRYIKNFCLYFISSVRTTWRTHNTGTMYSLRVWYWVVEGTEL